MRLKAKNPGRRIDGYFPLFPTPPGIFSLHLLLSGVVRIIWTSDCTNSKFIFYDIYLLVIVNLGVSFSSKIGKLREFKCHTLFPSMPFKERKQIQINSSS